MSSDRIGVPKIEPAARINPRNSARKFRLFDNETSNALSADGGENTIRRHVH
jgi:hypothetical protein